MAEWKTVRHDPNYVEPLDEEIIPLCDALNAAGFVTTSSCYGHGYRWPHIWFEHSDDLRIERLARFVKAGERGDYRPYFTVWQKEICSEGYAWSVEIHLNEVYGDTSLFVIAEKTNRALALITEAVERFSRTAEAKKP
jgi:hypothetical protein